MVLGEVADEDIRSPSLVLQGPIADDDPDPEEAGPKEFGEGMGALSVAVRGTDLPGETPIGVVGHLLYVPAEALPAGEEDRAIEYAEAAGRAARGRLAFEEAARQYARALELVDLSATTDDSRLFEKICLEGFQSGLSWRTILNKRENFRKAFRGFDFNKVARFGEKDVERLLQDAGIVRHRGKIEAVINNAKRAREMVKTEGSLAAFFWSYEPDPDTMGAPQSLTTSPESTAISKELKKRGWKFVGPTTVFAFIQAMGLINDHVDDCVVREKVAKARKRFRRPGG